MPDGMGNAVLYLYLSVLVFGWGACIGSFLNVCIYRIPLGLSVVKPRSHCPHCQNMITWHDNIPFLSFVVLKGKCRHCGKDISWRYFLVEMLTACLFFLVWLQLGYAPRPFGFVPISEFWVVPIYWLGVGGLILGTFVDFDHMIIPDRVTIGGTIVGLILSAIVPALHGQNSPLGGVLASASGAILGGGILWSIAGIGAFIFKKEAMGMGDVKLMAAIGAFLGWRSVLFTLMIASFIGATVGITLIILGKNEMKGRIPFGPYLSLAALLWMFWGPSIWGWYLNMFSFDLIGPGL